MKISIPFVNQGKTLQYAYQELVRFLQLYSNHQVGVFVDADYIFRLELAESKCDGGDYDYKVISKKTEGAKVVSITGSTEKGILSGVYDVLERMGMCFGMNGPVINGMLDITACDDLNFESHPFCIHRGIRQHINFPMDISSYHIEDAQEYIRNLARMGMNSITFHSYKGQWYAYEVKKETVYGGNYFYGQRHIVPDYAPISKNVNNKRYYCIPEIEEQLSDVKARSDFSIRWLNQVMEVCKEVGMQIMMSLELPDNETMDDLVKIVRGILTSYPLLDGIEWISPEGGGEGHDFPLEELKDRVREYFGEKPFVGGELPYMPTEMPTTLPPTMANLRIATDLYKRKDEILEGFENKKIAIGLYIMCKETLKFLKHVMLSVLPEEVLLTFLPAHGSLAVAENVEAMEFTKEQLQRTLLYSWIEFDGNMYMQQNSTKGIEKILKQTAEITNGKPIYGICFNHWRTAENEICAGYMAKATDRFETTASYYKAYATKLSIKEADIYAEAMKQLEEIDCYNRDNLFNVGFCYLGCWLAHPGLCWVRGWKKECVIKSSADYEMIMEKLNQCLAKTQALSSIFHLRFLINRIRCSILQLNCVYKLLEIADVVDDRHPERLTQEQKDWVAQQCDGAMKLCREYVDLHMELLPDRGCQGTAVSYYATMPVYVDHIKQYFVYGETVCTHEPETFDAPPAPDAAYLG